jgi:integrase
MYNVGLTPNRPYCGPKPDGRRGLIRESSRTQDEEKARKILATRVRQVANDGDGIAEFEGPAARRVTVAVLFDELLAAYRLKGIKGLDRVWYRIREGSPLRDTFGARQAREVTSARVTAYILARRAEGKANATINREVELLKRAFSLAVASGRVVRSPRFPARLPEDNVRQGFFEAADLAKLLPFLPEPLDDIARFASLTGWRRGELLGLRWEWVNLESREVTLPASHSKNGRARVLALEGGLLAIAKRQRARGVGAEWVFHRRGKPIHPSTFKKQWKAAREKAGLSEKLFHDFRRTAARNLTAAGVPEQVAMKVTGHVTNSMFRRYSIVTTEDVREALRKVQL